VVLPIVTPIFCLSYLIKKMEELERQMELIWRQERKRRGAGGVKSGASESILYLLCWRTIFIQQMYIQSFLYFY
jgi:hypothetical protein